MKNLLLNVCAMLLAISIIQAQETEEKKDKNQKQEKLYFKVKGNNSTVKGNAKPDIYVDGKKFDFELELLNQDKIESVSIIKDEQAIKEYNAPNGVILIKTKKEIDSDTPKTVVTMGHAIGSEKTNSDTHKVIVRGNSNFNGKAPVIIIDEKVSSKESLKKLSPDDIESIEVLKNDEKAIKKHNAPDGVIMITTKKGKEK